jgi:ligand-binding sensor domain-containing protein
MRKLLILLLALPLILRAQQKPEWTFYGPSFCYDKTTVIEKGLNVTGINDVIFTPDGTMVVSSVENPIIFIKDWKDYSTGGLLFSKEKSKLSLMKGGETSDALAMVVDQRNDFWFGTRKGLYRINASTYADLEKMSKARNTDGVKVPDDTPGMPFNGVNLIKQGTNGHLWVAGGKFTGLVKYEPKGVSEYDGATWKNFPVTGAEGKEVTRMTLDQQNNPIVASETGHMNNVISWLKDGQWKSLGSIGKDLGAEAIAVDKNNTLYAGTMNGIYVWKGEKWEKLETKKEIRSVKDLQFDASGNLWVATDLGAVCINASGGEYDLTQSNSPMPINAVKKIVVDKDNRKWFVTDAGILGFKEPQYVRTDRFNVYTKFNSGVFGGKIETMVPFKNGFLMVNDNIGLINYDGSKFSALTPSNQQEMAYYDVAVDKNGTAYMGTFRYLHKFDGSSYSKWDWKDDIGRQVNTVLIDDKNTVWIGFNGISKFDGSKWQNFDKKNAGLSSNTVLQLYQDSKGNIWAILPDGVAKYDGTAWTSFTKKTTGVQFRNMTGIAETKEGKMLFTNGYTLAEYDGTAMKAVDGFKEVGTVKNMIVDEDGSLLMATEEKGIARFKDGQVTYIDENNFGLPTNSINCIYKHTDGKIWVSCGNKPLTVGTAMEGEKPADSFNRKMREFDTFYGLVEISKL